MGDVDKTDSSKHEGATIVDNSDNVSVSSKASDSASVKSGIPKPSGIKPPSASRIGRLCMGQQPKVGLPPVTPPKNGSEDSLRKLTEEYSRHKLADVKEENEDDMALTSSSPSRRTRYSSLGSAASSSMDYLWDLHPRKLSEAGLSRHSDNSTILTEDTDSFIIGQRVWVGGTKPGHIAYIGETQFAPGEWAGIALDHPIGKNDGSVAGIRYFQCEPKKGIFSRLTRLTRYPLDGEAGGAGDYVTSTPVNGARNSLSPTCTSPFKSPPSLTTSNASLSSALIDFKIGDRVIIKSSQGSKIGTLRFMGCTEFAAGEWCGVELDEPRGKNDGSVGGKRYFDCRPNFGLFAPVSKVSKSPSSRKPGGCVIHSGTGIPPSGFRRANSKESITSNVSITSAASGVRRVRLGVTSLTMPQKTSPKSTTTPIPTRTALQEVLKEKQQHIEQLLKERDLERAELARAASQADEADQKYTSLKQEYDLYRDETEKKLQEHLRILDELKKDRQELVANLEDEKRKVEDLQFRYEEAAISKSDLEQQLSHKIITDEANKSRIKELETELKSNKQRIEALEADSNKLFEAEENLVRTREENEALKYEIEVAAKKILLLEADGTTSKELEQLFQKEVMDLKNIIKERDDVIEKFKKDMYQVSEQFESARTNFAKELEDYKKKLEDSNSEITNRDLQINQIKEELIKVENSLVEKSKLLESNSANSKEVEDKLTKEVNKLKMELSSKIHDIEVNCEAIAKKDEEIKKLAAQIENMKENVQSQNTDIEQYKENIKEVENNLRKELEESKNALKLKLSEIEDIKKLHALNLLQKENDLNEANKIVQNYKEEMNKMNEFLNQIKEESLNSKEEIKNIFESKLKESEDKIQNLNKDLEIKNSEMDKISLNLTRLENEVTAKVDEINRLQNELESCKKRIEEENQNSTKTTEEMTKLQLTLGDLERKLKISEDKNSELIQNKTKLEGDIQALIGSSGDFSTRLEELTKELSNKDHLIENIKSEFTLKVQNLERSKQEIELNYNNMIQKSDKDLKEIEDKYGKELLEKERLKQDMEKLSSENMKTVEMLNTKIKEYQNDLQEKNAVLEKIQNKGKEIEDKLKQELESSKKRIEEQNQNFTKTNEELTTLKLSLGDLEQKLKVSEDKNSELTQNKMKLEGDIQALIASSGDFSTRLEELTKELNNKDNLIENIKSEFTQKIQNLEKLKQEMELNYNNILQKSEKDLKEINDKYGNELLEKEKLKQDIEKLSLENVKTVEILNTKINEYQNELQEKCVLLGKIENKGKEIEDNLKQELEQKIKEFSAVTADLQNKLVEVSKENDNIKSELSTKTMELQRANDELSNVKEQVVNKDMTSSEKDNQISQLKLELQVNHQFVEKLRQEKEGLQREKDEVNKVLLETQTLTSKLNDETSKLNDELKTSGKMVFDLNHAANIYMTLLQMLTLTENQKIQLVDQLNDVIKGGCDEESYTKLCKLVDGIKVSSELSVEAKQLKETQEELLMYKKKYVEAEDKITRKDAEIVLMKKEHQVLSQSTKIPKPKVDNPSTSSTVNNNSATNEQLLEEKILAESQVAFLNAIIVDMQKKNEEQKARIEILEMGYSPAAAQELGLLGLADRHMPAPRMYCDICEEFDLHETEDCPQQASDDPPPREGSKKEKPPPRPYCDICEEFGHETENCQDDQTF